MGTFKTGGNYHSTADINGKSVTIDPRLVDIMQTAAAASNVNVTAFSGVSGRNSGTQNHPGGYAMDVQLSDPVTGKVYTSYAGNAFKKDTTWQESYPVYEQFAQAARVAQQEKYPELNDTFAWGGYWPAGNGNSAGPDMMHFQVTPGEKHNMSTWRPGLIGSWAGGVKSDFASTYGITSNGGLGGLEGARRVAQIQQSLLGGPVPPGDIPGAPNSSGSPDDRQVAPWFAAPAPLTPESMQGAPSLQTLAPPALPLNPPLPPNRGVSYGPEANQWGPRIGQLGLPPIPNSGTLDASGSAGPGFAAGGVASLAPSITAAMGSAQSGTGLSGGASLIPSIASAIGAGVSGSGLGGTASLTAPPVPPVPSIRSIEINPDGSSKNPADDQYNVPQLTSAQRLALAYGLAPPPVPGSLSASGGSGSGTGYPGSAPLLPSIASAVGSGASGMGLGGSSSLQPPPIPSPPSTWGSWAGAPSVPGTSKSVTTYAGPDGSQRSPDMAGASQMPAGYRPNVPSIPVPGQSSNTGLGDTWAPMAAAGPPPLPAPAYSPPTTQYTTKQMQVSNPAYLQYVEAQKADPIGAGPGSFADLQSALGTTTPAAPPPPQYITKTVQVPRPPAPIPLPSLGTVNPLTQVVPGIASQFGTSSLGHLFQLFGGEPVSGGLLQWLQRLVPPRAPGVPQQINGYGTGSERGGGSGEGGFLQAQGQNTSGMTAGELGNAYMKAIS